jgi:amicyanin
MRISVGVKQVLLMTTAALALTACAADQQKAAPPPPPSPSMDMPSSSTAAPAGAADAATANTVSIKDFAFTPSATTVKAGTTVTWTNRDQDPHTVTSTGSAGPLHSPTLQHGQTFRYTFTKPGHYDYLCTIHPFMTATVTVTA